MALEALTAGFYLAESLSACSPYIVPVIVDRVVPGEQFQFEPSEEARTRHILLLRGMMEHNVHELMGEHNQEILFITMSS